MKLCLCLRRGKVRVYVCVSVCVRMEHQSSSPFIYLSTHAIAVNLNPIASLSRHFPPQLLPLEDR